MCYQRLLVFALVLIFHGRLAEENSEEKCVQECRKKVKEKSICQNTCNDVYLEGRIKQDQERELPTPGIPTLFSSEYRSIRVKWNTTNVSNITAVSYILQVQPSWTNYSGNVYFPYIKKYHKVNLPVYNVTHLVAKMNYSFRVTAVTMNKTSSFSNWSDFIHTNNSCEKKKCGVTNFRMELFSSVPYKGPEDLNAAFYWEPTIESDLPDKRVYPWQYYFQIGLLSTNENCKNKLPGIEYKEELEKENVINKSLSTHNFINKKVSGIEQELYFDCWYQVKIRQKNLLSENIIGSTWNFHTPECIKSPKICGCNNVVEEYGEKFFRLNSTQTSENTSSVILNWSDERWRNDTKVKYYAVHISITIDGNQRNDEYYVDSKEYIHTYSKALPNLINNLTYYVQISAYHSDHCKHNKVEKVKIIVPSPCRYKTCPEHSFCRRDGYLREIECPCVDGYVLVDGVCTDSTPCTPDPCAQNETCYQGGPTGSFHCNCTVGFAKMNETSCRAICEIYPDAEVCPTKKKLDNPNNIGAIVAAVVTPLVIIIIIAICVIFWMRHFQKKRLRSLEYVMDSITYNAASGNFTLRNPYNDVQPLRVILPSDCEKDEDDTREFNVIYVPQEISDAIARGLTDGLFELPHDRLNLGKVIGRGAFGEVCVGEAHCIMDIPGWTTVAVKKLADSATDVEIEDFLGEIQLMKALGSKGKHDNVIQMYGCCTVNVPICLILEYASGGNLLVYLRSLKRQCEKTAMVTENAESKDTPGSKQNKFKKFFEPGEMPQDSASYSFPYEPPTYEESFSGDSAEDRNSKIAARVNREIQTALDPKELESFARQIANGMTHVAELGIIHRDLAARNILLNANKVLKISDFGLSREGIYIKKTRGKIPFRWLSIEAILERCYSTASDVWAFGIVLWEICTLGDVPYSSVNDKDLADFLASGNRMKKAASCTDDIYEIMLKCWSHRPEDRPSFSELSNLLLKLEHEGDTYVNVETLMESSSPSSAVVDEDDISAKDTKQDNNSTESSYPKLPDASKGLDNQAFWHSSEDLNADEKKPILPGKKQPVNETDEDGATSPQKFSNGISSNGINTASVE